MYAHFTLPPILHMSTYEKLPNPLMHSSSTVPCVWFILFFFGYILHCTNIFVINSLCCRFICIIFDMELNEPSSWVYCAVKSYLKTTWAQLDEGVLGNNESIIMLWARFWDLILELNWTDDSLLWFYFEKTTLRSSA